MAGIAEDETGVWGWLAELVVGEPVDADAASAGLCSDVAFVGVCGQAGDQMEAGGDALDSGLGEVAGEGVDGGGSAVPVPGPGAAQVLLEGAGADQVGEGELVRHAGAEVDTGARNVDHILTRTLLPEMSAEFLARMAERKTIREVRIAVADDETFRYDIR